MKLNFLKKVVCLSLFVGYNFEASHRYEKLETRDLDIEMTGNSLVKATVYDPMGLAAASSSSSSQDSILKRALKESRQANASLTTDDRSQSCSVKCQSICTIAAIVLSPFVTVGGLMSGMYVLAHSDDHTYKISNQQSNFIRVLYESESLHCARDENDEKICMKYIAPHNKIEMPLNSYAIKLCITDDSMDYDGKICANAKELQKYFLWCVHDDLTLTHGDCSSSESMMSSRNYTSEERNAALLYTDFTNHTQHLRGSK